MSVVYVLTTLIPEYGDDATVEQLRKRPKFDNDDYDSVEAKYMVEDASSKKFLVSNFTNYKMTDSRSVMEQYNEILGIFRRFTQHKMNMNGVIQVSYIIDKLPPSWNYFKHTLKHLKEELTLVELGSHLRIEESLRVQDSDKPKRNNVAGPSVVNMIEHNNFTRYNDNMGKRKHHDNKRADPNKKAKRTKGSVDGSSNSLKGATVHVYKDRCWFKTYDSLNDGSILHMRNESTALVHGHGCVDLRLNIGNDNIGSAFMSTSKLNDLILWHARLGHIHFKRMQDMSKDGLIPAFDIDIEKWNKKYFVTFIDDASSLLVLSIVGIKRHLSAVEVTAASYDCYYYWLCFYCWLQKIVRQLAILGENILQEDLNLKFLRSLPFEWNTHVVFWRNKPDLDPMSFDISTTISRLLNKRLKELQAQAQAQVLRYGFCVIP
ncbi:zinc finger, CCHC-type containing protein [Tanacetum coccineum]